MQFKKWFNEETKLLKNLAPSGNYNYLGKLSWWHVYSISSNGMENDYMLDDSVKSKLKKIFEDSAYKLSLLGFPRMTSTVILTDLSNEIDITGRMTVGYANYKYHGIALARNRIEESTLIHEHAHMFWKNLPKPNKEFFIEYYKNSLDKFNKNLSNKTKFKHFGNLQMPEEKKLFNLGWSNFRDNLEKEINVKLDILFDLKKTDDQKLLLIKSILNNRNIIRNVKLKIPIEVNRYNSSFKKLSIGDEVQVFDRGDSNYLIEKYYDHERYDYEKILNFEELLNHVDFDIKKIMSNDYYRKNYESSLELKNKSLVEILGFTKNKGFIEKAFEESFETIVYWINSENFYKFDVDQFFKRYGRSSNSWISLISKRSKSGKIKSEDDLKDVYEFIAKKMFTRDLTEIEPKNFDLTITDLQQKMKSPEGEELRSLFHKSGASVSPYGASNIDELWATTVEFAATYINVSTELKNLIKKTINGF